MGSGVFRGKERRTEKLQSGFYRREWWVVGGGMCGGGWMRGSAGRGMETPNVLQPSRWYTGHPLGAVNSGQRSWTSLWEQDQESLDDFT